jgi:hypothetical protein
MLGSSLLREAGRRRSVPMTSCNVSSNCPIDTWGMLGEAHALVAQSWDGEWKCVRLDDRATLDPEAPECAELQTESKAYFATRPDGAANR